MDAQHFFIKGSTYAATELRLQYALASVYETPERPRCLCVRGGVEMYVAKHRLFVVKRMPDTGAMHDPLCPSYEPELKHSGLRELMGTSVIDRGLGGVELRVEFPLARVPGRCISRGEQQGPSGGSAPRHRMSLRAVMHFLFERAEFNRWYPAMEGKRNQGVLHKYLTEAADEVVTKGVRLSERLYVPEPFNEAKKSEIAERRRSKLALLHSPQDETQFKMALVLGEFKSAEAGAVGHRVWIRHMPDAPLLIDSKAWERIERAYKDLFAAREADTVHRPRIVMCALISAMQEHVYQVEMASFMLTTDQWIPIEGVHELKLIDALIEQKRSFVKPLRYDAKSVAPFPNALLLDTGERPVPLHIVSAFMSEKEQALKERAVKAEGEISWAWYTAEPMPPFPVQARRRGGVADMSP